MHQFLETQSCPVTRTSLDYRAAFAVNKKTSCVFVFKADVRRSKVTLTWGVTDMKTIIYNVMLKCQHSGPLLRILCGKIKNINVQEWVIKVREFALKEVLGLLVNSLNGNHHIQRKNNSSKHTADCQIMQTSVLVFMCRRQSKSSTTSCCCRQWRLLSPFASYFLWLQSIMGKNVLRTKSQSDCAMSKWCV